MLHVYIQFKLFLYYYLIIFNNFDSCFFIFMNNIQITYVFILLLKINLDVFRTTFFHSVDFNDAVVYVTLVVTL